MTDLKPCPFCGGEASVCDDQAHATAYYFGCQTEGCCGHMLWAETHIEAVDAWNAREPSVAEAALREIATSGRCDFGKVRAALRALAEGGE